MKRGFTIVEILISFGVLALIIGITVTYLRYGAPEQILRGATQNITTDLRYAAELASATQVNHAVIFDATARVYTMMALSTPTQTIKTVALTEGLQITANTLPNNQAEFNALGAAITPGTITLQYQGDKTAVIEVRPSGYVQIH